MHSFPFILNFLILWTPDVKIWLIWKDPDAGKDWGQEEKETKEDEMVGWHHQLNGHEFGWTPGVSDGQGGLACCGSWGYKESDTTKQLNWTELKLLNLPIFIVIKMHYIKFTILTISRHTVVVLSIKSCPTLSWPPWAPLSMGFPREKY